MIVRCSKCSTEFDLDPRQVGAEGVTLRCSVCSHMFHAEPNPEAAKNEPWQVVDEENRLHTFVDMAGIIEAIEDGRVLPDAQISRTGRHWLRLGDLPELSTVFVGFDGLPRVFKAIELAPSATPGPPPAFGDLAPPPPPPFGEDSRRSPVSELGSGLRAPPAAPASMLAAVTKAVGGPGQRFRPATVGGREADAATPRRELASQPIVLSDTTTRGEIPRADAADATAEDSGAAAAAAASAASAGSVTSRSAVEGSGSASAPAPAPALASSAAAASVAASQERAAAPPAAGAAAPAPGGSNGKILGMVALVALVAGALVLAVPSVRERIFGVQAAPTVKAEAPTVTEDLALADRTIHTLSLAESDRVQKALQKAIDERLARGWPVEALKLAQTELIMTRGLAFKIAASLDPKAVEGMARSRAEEDLAWGRELAAELKKDAASLDRARWGRVQALQALGEGSIAEALAALPPSGAEELRLWISAAALWQSAAAPVPSGLIGGLQTLPGPSTTSLALQGLALQRGGDLEGAQAAVSRALAAASDQPLASTISSLLATAAAAANDEADSVTPEDPAIEGESGDSELDPGRRPRPATGSGGGSDTVESLVSRGCDEARGGDAAEGVGLLLRAYDRGVKSLEVHLCLGAAHARLKNYRSSNSFYERALEQDRGNVEASRGVAVAADRLGRKSSAIELYKRLLELVPDDEDARAFLTRSGVAIKPAPQPGEDPPPDEDPLPEMLKPEDPLLPIRPNPSP